MNKKRLLIFVLLVALVMALAACSPDYKWGPLDTGAADNSPLVSNGGSVVMRTRDIFISKRDNLHL